MTWAKNQGKAKMRQMPVSLLKHNLGRKLVSFYSAAAILFYAAVARILQRPDLRKLSCVMF